MSLTDDQSPTLWPFEAQGAEALAFKGFTELKRREPEKMHTPKGALSETLFIYGQAVERVFTDGLAPRFVPVGLGLAYIEWVIVAAAQKHGALADFQMLSFEAHPVLREHFLAWLQDPEAQCGATQSPCLVAAAFQKVLELVAEAFQSNVEELRQGLLAAYQQGRWRLASEIEESLASGLNFKSLGWSDGASGIFYDPYSNQSTPQIWCESFLAEFLNRLAGTKCIFASYAATGALNRALKSTGFKRQKSIGYAGKRESTLGLKGY